MNIIELLPDLLPNKGLSAFGIDISAGFSETSETTADTMTAQYPAERSSANDTSTDSEVNDLYKNGILFTAYDYKSRTTPDLRTTRISIQKAYNDAKKKIDELRGKVKSSSSSNSMAGDFTKNPVANILLPRSKTDAEMVSHKFNDVGESLITRGGGTATGILSNVASTAVFGAIESVTNGVMADHGEQIYNTARSMYAGPENRTKTFTWELTPRTVEDLIQIVKIYELFNYYSYGVTGNSQYAKEVKSQIDGWYKKTFINNLTPEGSDRSGTIMESVTSFLSNVIVVSNPTVWFIRPFGKVTEFDGRPDIFGPAQIQSIRFDKAPDGNFNGLAIAPNLPSTFVLEVTMREILTLSRSTVYGEDIL